MQSDRINALLIEDNPDDAILLQAALEDSGGNLVTIEWVERLTVGLKRLEQGGVDVVLLDLSLPDGQGLETVSKVCSQAPTVPVVVLTGLDDGELSLAAVREGAQDYLVKGEAEGELLIRSIRYAIQREASENAIRASEEAARRLAHENSVMAEIGRIVSSSLNIVDVYERFANQVRSIVPFDRIDISLSNPNEGLVTHAYFTGTVVPGRQRGDVYELRGTLTEALYINRLGLLFHSETRDVVSEQFPGLLSAFDAGLRSWVATPLISGDEVIGGLFLGSFESNAYDEHQLQLTERVGAQIAGAISNAQLYAERQRAETELKASLEEKQTLLEEIQLLYTKERHRFEQLRVIGEVGRQITSILDVNELLAQMVMIVQKAFNYYHVGIGLIDNDEVDYLAGAGVLWDDPAFEFVPIRLKIGQEGITGSVAQSGEAALIPDVDNDERYIRMRHANTRSELAVPIRFKGSVIGVLDVQSDRENDFDESDVVLLQSLADQAGVAIQNARLFHSEERRTEGMKAIIELGVKLSSILTLDELLSVAVELMQNTFGHYSVNIGLIDRSTRSLVVSAGAGGYRDSAPVGDVFDRDGLGICAWVAKTGKMLLANDVSKEPRYFHYEELDMTKSELAIPLAVGDRVTGVLDIQSSELNGFDEIDVFTAQIFANQLAVAIENARLFEGEERRLDQMRAINELGVKVSSVLSIDELLPFAVNLVQDAFDYYSVVIALIDDDSNRLVFKAGAGGFVEAPPLGRSMGLDDNSMSSWVARTGQILLANDVSKEPRYKASDVITETKAELTVPIIIGDSVLGILDIQSRELNSFSDADVSTAQILANQIAVAIENARLFEESQDMAVLGERNRMAREMHDTLAQGFTGIVLQLEAAEQSYEDNSDELTDHLAKAKALARECLQEARRSVWNLLPQALEQKSLESALHDEVRRFSLVGREKATFTMTGEKRELPPAVQAAILRICQESLTNIRKHAQASQVWIELDVRPDYVALKVRDNGVGIDPRVSEASRAKQGGFGMLGMEQRALQLKGTFTVNSSPGEGTLIEVVVPIQ
jgi:GAF domain-containing protein/anti-sigma regulatory factor (Ser/Thr protein kinase)